MTIDIRLVGPEQHLEFITPLLTGFGAPIVPERVERMQRLADVTHRFAAYDGDTIAGCAGTMAFTMTTPGGAVPVAGLTMVGVLPTHRRRGVMSALVRQHLDEARASGQPVSALWASEGSIYGRFGYGLGSLVCSGSIERDRSAFITDVARAGRVRLVTEEEALRTLPEIWERVRPTTPGMLSRSPSWWQNRRLADLEKGAPPMQRVVLELDGRPEAYALYRHHLRWESTNIPDSRLQVHEAMATSPLTTRLIWRYLLDIDLMQRIEVSFLPPDHPLLLMLLEPRRLRLSATDALWVRVLDVEAALGSRAWGSQDALTIQVDDALYPSNSGRYRIDGAIGLCARTDAPAALRLDIATLGAAWLGGFSVRRLADAGRVEELQEGAIARADALFRSSRAPWCPEIF